MILIIWLFYSLAIFVVGACIAFPWWFARFFQPRFWCESCHHDITVKQKFLASFNGSEEYDRKV